MTQNRTNQAASVHKRLLNLSRERGEEFQFLLTQFALERLLSRLSESEHADRFVLKGAMLFALWTGIPHRATKDMDLLGFGDNDIENMVKLFGDLCGPDSADDGLDFRSDSVKGDLIKEGQDYQAVRIRLIATLGAARIPLQIDIGFGDANHLSTVVVDYPALLNFPQARIRAYRKETVIAEKFHAMVSLGIGNSRMKDFYDIWVLSRQFTFEAEELVGAIRATFSRRKTLVPKIAPLALTSHFAMDPNKLAQWKGFTRKGRLRFAPPELTHVTTDLCGFLLPLLQTTVANANWAKGGPWKTSE